jgi:hypothetical protein
LNNTMDEGVGEELWCHWQPAIKVVMFPGSGPVNLNQEDISGWLSTFYHLRMIILGLKMWV